MKTVVATGIQAPEVFLEPLFGGWEQPLKAGSGIGQAPARLSPA